MKTLKHRRKQKGDFVSYVLFVSSDAIAILIAFACAYRMRFGLLSHFFKRESPEFSWYLWVLPVVVAIFLIVFRQKQIYIFDILRRRLDEIILIAKAISIAAIILMAATFLYRDFSYSRSVFLLHCFFSFFFVCFFRHITYRLDGAVRIGMGTRTRVLIMGTNRSARQIIRRINRSYRNRYEVIGVLSGGRLAEEKHFESVPILGNLDDIFQKTNGIEADEIILTVPDFPGEKLTELFLKCENELITFLKMPDLFGIFTSGVDVHYIDDVPLIGIKKSPLDKMSSRFLKRSFDLAGSILCLFLLAPALSIISILVKCSSAGTVFYRQERIGIDGRSFLIFKFRTMRLDAESKTGPVWASKNDQRTTPAGRILRKFNLDELPQLWNVLKGEMSLVGPRPERPHFVGQFRADIPRYMARHKIKSGITGWAQVNGFRGNTSINERTKYDLYYYENWSLALDLKIVFLTFFAFKNAY